MVGVAFLRIFCRENEKKQKKSVTFTPFRWVGGAKESVKKVVFSGQKQQLSGGQSSDPQLLEAI